MKIVIMISCLAVFIPFTLMANDAADSQISRNNEIKEIRQTLGSIIKKEASDDVVRAIISTTDAQGKDIQAVALAVQLYALSSNDNIEKKENLIQACASRNPNGVAILYQCAIALEPKPEGILLHKQIIEKPDSSVTMKVLALRRLFGLGEFPAKTPEVLISGLLSANKNDAKTAYELYEKLRDSKFAKASEYTEKIRAALIGTNVLELFSKP